MLLLLANEGGHHATGNAPVELLLVSLVLLMLWGVYRITSKKHP